MSVSNEPTESDFDHQAKLLQNVSRTFALTIPQLPRPLRNSYGNTYLLCRITDIIEDEPSLPVAQKKAFFEELIEVIAGRKEAEPFARKLGAALSPATTENERGLVANVARVVRVTHGFNANQRNAIERCIKIMSRGMIEFQQSGTSEGLDDLPHFNHYCYHVAGVVGETKTELLCDYSARLAGRREDLLGLSVSFGEGLQITNILKDVWEDRQRGDCWLPRKLFLEAGFDLDSLATGESGPGFTKGLFELITIARYHLMRTLRYTLLVPRRDAGVRVYCLWTIGLAVLTLRRLHATPEYKNRQQIEPSRRSVRAFLAFTKIFARSNLALKLLFWSLTRRLPDTGARHLMRAQS